MKARHICGAVIASLVIAGCGGGQSTPEETARTFKESLSSGDFDAAFDCLDTGAQRTLIGGLYMGAAYKTAGNLEQGMALSELAETHNLNELRAEAVDSAQLAAIFGDLIAWMEVAAPEMLQKLAESAAATEYSEFEIDGDRATAKTTKDGKKTRDTRFVEVKGRWLVN